MPDFGLRVEGDNGDERSFSWAEKVWNLPFYIVRKLVLFLCVFLLYVVSLLSFLFGFRFDHTFADEPRWRWLEDFSLPRYGLERKD